MTAILIFCGLVNLNAQRIRIVDNDGQPVTYATVVDADDQRWLGTTDMEGVLANVEGAKKVHIRHVAFKPKTVVITPEGGRIVMEDADFNIPEVVVKALPLIYVQTYYRVVYMTDGKVYYYRSGICDNAYDVKKQKLSFSSSHYSKAEDGMTRFLLDKALGWAFNKYAKLRTSYVTLGDGKKTYQMLTPVPETDTRQRLEVASTPVGYMVDDLSSHLRSAVIDGHLYAKLRRDEERAEKGKPKKEEGRSQKNKTTSRYIVYQMDDDRHCGIADFVSEQIHTEFDSYDSLNKSQEHVVMWIELYATDRAYVDADGLKEKKRANRVAMNPQSLQQFERQHNIPALPPNFIKAINELETKKNK